MNVQDYLEECKYWYEHPEEARAHGEVAELMVKDWEKWIASENRKAAGELLDNVMNQQTDDNS
jgi:hypothetical protein